MAAQIRTAPFFAVIDREYTSLPPTRTGQIVEVEIVDRERLSMLPVDGEGGNSSSFAGNSAYWSGAAVAVEQPHGGLEVVPLPLAAGGSDTLARLKDQLAEIDLDTLVGACAAVRGGYQEDEGADLDPLSESSLLAVAQDEASKPIPLDPAVELFLNRREPTTLGELSAAG